MTKKQKRMLVTEFVVSVYGNGRIEWGGIDGFLWWLMHRKPREGFLPHGRLESSGICWKRGNSKNGSIKHRSLQKPLWPVSVGPAPARTQDSGARLHKSFSASNPRPQVSGFSSNPDFHPVFRPVTG